MLEQAEIAYAKFLTEKEKGPFIYEMRLLQLDLTSEYLFLRRWYYRDQIEQSPWKQQEDWNIKDKKRFMWKLVQKRDIMGFELIEERGLDILEN